MESSKHLLSIKKKKKADCESTDNINNILESIIHIINYTDTKLRLFSTAEDNNKVLILLSTKRKFLFFIIDSNNRSSISQ